MREGDLVLVLDLRWRGDLLNDAGDLGAGELALGGRSTRLPLRGSCDVVAFVSEPDSMISPSEGVDGDLDLRDAILRPSAERYIFFSQRSVPR